MQRSPLSFAAIILFAVLVAIFIVHKGNEAANELERLNSGAFGVHRVALAEELDLDNRTLDISNWKTYRSEKYGFEVKYPRNFLLKSWHDAGATALSESIEIYNFKMGIPTEGKIMPMYNFVLYINPPEERIMDPKSTRNGGFFSPQDLAREGGYTLSSVTIGGNTFLKDSNNNSYHFKDPKTAGYFDLTFSFSDEEELKNSPIFIGLKEQYIILESILSSLKVFN